MMKLEGLAAFVAVAEAGSVSEAARREGVAKSVMSERLAELERAVGARLIQRTTRKLSLTEDGLAVLPRARRILHEASEAGHEIAARRGGLHGPLRLSAPVSFGTLHLGAAVFRFLVCNPGVDLSLDLDDRFVDIAAGGFDAVIRHGAVRDSWIVARRLARSRRLLVASPDYLGRYGAPASLTELEQHAAILYANRNADWRFIGQDGAVVVRPRPGLRLNNGLLMRDAALAGLGVTLLPTFMMAPELRSGALVAISLDLEPEGAEIFIAHDRESGRSAKIEALTLALRAAFGDPPYWDAGIGPPAPDPMTPPGG